MNFLKSKTNSGTKILILTGMFLIVLMGVLMPIQKTHAESSTDQGTCVYTAIIDSSKTPPITQQKTRTSSRGWCTSTTRKGQFTAFPVGSEHPVCTNPPYNTIPEGCVPESVTTGITVDESGNIIGKVNTPPDPPGSCSFRNFFTWDCIASLLARLAWLIMGIASLILGLAGVLLDYVINETVLTMKEGLDKMTGINIAWRVVRDILNIAFIFLLVYQGIKMILGLTSIDNIKKFISMIILASLLVNFSLFFTKILIDASNIVTIGVYNATIDRTQSTQVSTPNNQTKTIAKGLTVPFMDTLGLTGFFSGDSFNKIEKKVGGGNNMLIFFGMGTVVFLVTSFVFFAIACMFVIRYVVLIVLLMLSPVAFMGLAIPQLKKYADEWWRSLNGQLLFAPIYMIMTSVILALMSSKGFIKGDAGSWGDVINGTNSAMGLILNFAVIIGLLIASLVIAKTTATQGSDLIGKATGKFTAFAGGAVMGSAAAGLRKTAGAWADRKANDENLKAAAAGIGVTKTQQAAAQAKLASYRKVASSSFDVRRSRLGEGIASQTGVSLGSGTVFNDKAGKGGYKKEREKATEKHEEYIKSLKPAKEKEKELAIEAERKLKESDKYKDAKVVENTAKEDENKAREELQKAEEKKKELDKKLKSATMMNRADIEKEIAENDKDIEQKKKDLEKMEKASKAASEETEEMTKKARDVWGSRIEAYATSLETAGPMSRYGTLLAKMGTQAIVGGVVAGPIGAIVGGAHAIASSTPSASTKQSRRELAQRIRGMGKQTELSAKEKAKLNKIMNDPDKPEDERKDAAKKLGQDFDEINKKEE